MIEPLTRHRREFLAKALIDVVKLLVAGAIATEFFSRYPTHTKFLLWILIFALFFGSWAMQPAKGEK